VAHHVAHRDADRAVRQLEQVVPVAADLRRGRAGQVAGGVVQPGDRRQLREQAALQLLGDLVLAGVEPGVVDGERRATAEVGRHGQVVLVEGAAGAVGEQRQHAQHLPPGPQRQQHRRAEADLAVQLGQLGVLRAGVDGRGVHVQQHRRAAAQHLDGLRVGAQAGGLLGLQPAQQHVLVRVAVPGGDPLHLLRAVRARAVEQVDRAPVRHHRDDQAGQPVQGLVDVQRGGQHRGRLGQQREPPLGALRLGPGGPLGGQVQLALLLGLHPDRHVGLDADEVGQPALRVVHGRDGQLVPEGRAVLAVVEQRDGEVLLALQRVPDALHVGRVGVRALQEAAVAAEHLLAE
jgi:hypothetical protein